MYILPSDNKLEMNPPKLLLGVATIVTFMYLLHRLLIRQLYQMNSRCFYEESMFVRLASLSTAAAIHQARWSPVFVFAASLDVRIRTASEDKQIV